VGGKPEDTRRPQLGDRCTALALLSRHFCRPCTFRRLPASNNKGTRGDGDGVRQSELPDVVASEGQAVLWLVVAGKTATVAGTAVRV